MQKKIINFRYRNLEPPKNYKSIKLTIFASASKNCRPKYSASSKFRCEFTFLKRTSAFKFGWNKKLWTFQQTFPSIPNEQGTKASKSHNTFTEDALDNKKRTERVFQDHLYLTIILSLMSKAS